MPMGIRLNNRGEVADMNRKIQMVLMAGVVMVAGCSHAPLQKGFSESTEANNRIQTINPKAGKDDVPVATLDGQKSERLLKSYRSDSGKASAGSLVEGGN